MVVESNVLAWGLLHYLVYRSVNHQKRRQFNQNTGVPSTKVQLELRYS